MIKKKILFYGNCQTGVIGQWIHDNYSDKFEVIDCQECGLVGFFGTKNFAVWSPENSPNQESFYECIQSKTKECDIFVFTHIEDRAIEGLKTRTLCDIAPNKIKVCLPNLRFSAYPICRASLQPFVRYVYQTISKEPKKIYNYLSNELDPKFEEIVHEQYKTCMVDENIKRYNTDFLRYENAIEVNNFISKNWKNYLLFGTIAHPIGIYWREVIKQLFKFLDESLDVDKLDNINYPSKDGIHDPRTFSFFNKMFPDIIIPSEIGRFYDTNINLIEDLVKNYDD